MPTKTAPASQTTPARKIKSRRTVKSSRTKAPATSGRLLPRKMHVIIDGIPITLHAAKGKRTLTAAQLEAAMKQVIAERPKHKA